MQRYYYYYKSYNVSPNGSPLGHWESRLANSKKEILATLNPKGRHYARHVKKVYTEAEAVEIAKTNTTLAKLIKESQ